MLPDDHYAVVKASLVTRASRRLREGTPFDQRMADALVEVCRADASEVTDASGDRRAGGPRRIRPTVVVHADLSFLAGGDGGAEIDVLGPVAREVARRLACDAKVLVSADDPTGQSLNLGRSQTRTHRSPTNRHQATRQGLPIPGMHAHRVHRCPPRPALGGRRNDGPVQPRRTLRPASPLRPRDGLDDVGRRQRGVDLPEPYWTSLHVDAFAHVQLSARRTAWLMASWRTTLSARLGTRTRTIPGPSVPNAASSSEMDHTSATASPNPRATAATSLVGGVPNSRSKVSVRHRSGLREEGEDPSSPVVHDDEDARQLREIDQSRHVVEEGQVSEQRQRRDGRLRRGDPEGRRDDTVNAVDPTIGQHPGGTALGCGVPLQVPQRHGRGHHQVRRVRRGPTVYEARRAAVR